jgi:hypothetical protein
MIDPKMFTVEALLEALIFDDVFGNVDMWRKHAEIVTHYMPPYPTKDTRPACVVRFGGSFLRGYGGGRAMNWDMYGDDYGTPAKALIALLAAPVPPDIIKPEVWQKNRAWLDERARLAGER